MTSSQDFVLDPSGRRIYLSGNVGFDIKGLAWMLSRKNRFAGATLEPYNVAQHSLIMAAMAEDPTDKLGCLVHDLTEAVMEDLARPVKKHCPDYREAERVLLGEMCNFFEIQLNPIVKELDDLVFALECASPAIARGSHFEWAREQGFYRRFPNAEYEYLIEPMGWRESYNTFLEQWNANMRRVGNNAA